MMDYIIYGVTFLGLLVGSITDIDRREVPDWISYSLMFLGIGLRFIYSVVTNDWMYLLYGLIGFAILFGLAYLMFYTGQWGGGDSKVLIGMGALMATTPKFLSNHFNPYFANLPFLLAFWINLLIVGAIYAILWSGVMGIIHHKDFIKKAKEKLMNKKLKKLRILMYIICGILIVLGFLIPNILVKIILFVVGAVVFIFYFAWIFIRAIEESCMYKKVNPDQLTEGDWIVKDIIIDGKFICGPKTLGVEMKHIRKLKEFHKQNKINKVLIKNGIPFIPSFFVAFIITSIWGNFVFSLIIP